MFNIFGSKKKGAPATEAPVPSRRKGDDDREGRKSKTIAQVR